ANSALCAKTVLFATYDENGGFFDHLAPVTAPPGTPDEYITAPAVPDPTVVGTPPILGPIGLGFRVPMLVISPFSRGGFVSSALFHRASAHPVRTAPCSPPPQAGPAARPSGPCYFPGWAVVQRSCPHGIHRTGGLYPIRPLISPASRSRMHSFVRSLASH